MSHAYLLRPFDKLFVKDGRPLSLEDDSAAAGLFPPPPSVIFGALRSAVLAKADSPSASVGTATDPAHAGARLTGYAFAKTRDGNTELYFPAPRDLVREKKKDATARAALSAQRLGVCDEIGLTSAPTPMLLQPSAPKPVVESVGGYISATGLARYLDGSEVPADQLLEPKQLYEPEPKLGIGLDYSSGTTKDGLLYTMAMQRLYPGVTLAVRTEGFGESGQILRLGAEARAVEVLEARNLRWPQAGAPSGKTLGKGSYVTLYLATPAVFKNGWLPDFLTATGERKFDGELAGASVRLLAASIGRYEPLGGWDIVARRPKPMRKAVPAGSVYHFEVTAGELDAEAVHGEPLKSGFPHSGRADGDHVRYEAQGFGIAYLGVGPATYQSK